MNTAKFYLTLAILASDLALQSTCASADMKTAAPAQMRSQKQGLHEWPLMNGRLILVNGTYEDFVQYKRSLVFYFEEETDPKWLHVPIFDGKSGYQTVWWTASQGEQTLADAVVTADADGIKLVTAQTKSGANSSILVVWYRFTEAGENYIERPAYFFEQISFKKYSAKSGSTVKKVLEDEIAAHSKK